MAHGIEAAIEAAVSTETDATDIMGETHQRTDSDAPADNFCQRGIAMR